MRRRYGSPTTVALCVLALAVAGCGAPRSGAVSETGPCAQVLPLAETHVHGRGRLLRVKALKRKELRALLASLTPRAPLPRGHSHPARQPRAQSPRLPKKACVLVYRGAFAGGPRGNGRYLILLIKVRHPAVLDELVTDRVPSSVGRRT